MDPGGFPDNRLPRNFEYMMPGLLVFFLHHTGFIMQGLEVLKIVSYLKLYCDIISCCPMNLSILIL